MPAFLILLPLVVLSLLVVTGRASLLRAGITSLCLMIPILGYVLPDDRALGPFLLAESLRGLWLSWPAVAIILSGLIFHETISHNALLQPRHDAAASAISQRQLFFRCFLLGTFAECATGFGVGAILVVSALTKEGISPIHCVLLSLLSEVLIPWAALSVGTIVGATLVPMPAHELGVTSALLSIPILIGFVILFWSICCRIGISLTHRQCIDDLGWMCLICGTLYASNRFLSVEISGLTAMGSLTVLRFIRDSRFSSQALRDVRKHALPFVILVFVLLMTRLYPPIALALQHFGRIQPELTLPAYFPMFHVSFWMMLVAFIYSYSYSSLKSFHISLQAAWRMGRNALGTTIVFVILSRWMSVSGMTDVLANGWFSFAGSASLVASPVIGAISGILTGNTAAANGMAMSVQVSIAQRLGTDSHWIAGIQNTAGSAFTMLSPIRTGMIAAAAGFCGSERLLFWELRHHLLALSFGLLVATCAALI